MDEEEPSEGETEVCLIGIRVKKREREREERERKDVRRGGTGELHRTPLCTVSNLDHDEKVNNIFCPVIPSKT